MAYLESHNTTSGVSKLPLHAKDSSKTSIASKQKQVVDSWEDEELSSDTETEQDGKLAPSASDSNESSAAAPTPTTVSYCEQEFAPTTSLPVYHVVPDPSGPPTARPEKTDAVARRMIANALGMRAPMQTDEQKAYDKAIRVKERSRRDEEKASRKRKEEEAAKARAAIWDD